jgi:general secretion pathway protein D
MNRATLRLRLGAVGLGALLLAGCATSSAAKRGDEAAKRQEWDAAVAYYREALGHDPKRVDVQIDLERATRNSSTQHVARGRELEAQDQLAGAAAEYRLAIEFDPSNALAMTRALDVERRIREQIEASRPQSRMDQMRQQAAQQSPIPRLDPRVPLPTLKFQNTSIRDVLQTVGTATGISIQYDQGLEGTLSKSFTVDLTGHNLESAFNMVLSQNQLVYKIIDSRTIFIYADNAGNRAKYEDVYQQTFYLSHADEKEVGQILNQMLTTTTAGNRPVITQNTTAHSLVVRATVPMLGVIKNIIDGADKPRAEVLIDVTILEVDRSRLKNLGIDLNNYAINLTYSPNGAPGANGAVPPITVGDIGKGQAGNNFYLGLPGATINILMSDQKTKLLAKPQLRGREGSPLTLNLGQDVPVAQTSFLAAATGGVATTPQVQYQFRPIGVNLSLTPKVTYQDEIILDPITIDKSAIGPNVDVGGVSLQSFIRRTASVSMRLRDGESNMLAGLILDEERETARSVPGILNVPVIRSIFGNTNGVHDQSDVVMIVTPHIVRSRDITAEDLKPFYVGTSNNLGAATAPGLISQAPPPAAVPPANPNNPTGPIVAPPTPPNTPPPGAPPVNPPAAAPPVANPAIATTGNPANPKIVAVEAVTPASNAPAPGAQILLTVPASELQKDGPPYTLPISIANVSQLGAVTLTITYDPKVLKAVSVSASPWMNQGGVTPTFVPKIDAALGRIDIAIMRPGTSPGASGTGMLAAVVFQGVGAGTSKITVTGSALTPETKAIPLAVPPAGTIVVK